jgi:ProP effector
MNIAVNKTKPILRLKFGTPPMSPPEPLSVKVMASEVPPKRPMSAERATAIQAEKAVVAERLAIKAAIQQRAAKTMEILAERFPLCFGKPTPLKVNIHRDIFAAAPDLDRHDITNALHNYCSRNDYKTVLVEGAVRVDLNGQPAGGVTRSHVTLSIRQLQKSDF